LTTEHQVAESGVRRPSGTSLRLRASNPTILCGLWVAVIALAVAIDLAK
jgi:hypothetical protein